MCEPLAVPSRERSRSPHAQVTQHSSAPEAVKTYYEFMNFCSLCRLTSTKSECIEFCQHFGLLPKSVICTNCGVELTKLNDRKGRLEFRCQKRQCRKTFSAKKGTWFEKGKIPLRKSLFLTYLFVSKSDIKSAIRETSGPDFDFEWTSNETVVDFFHHCREVCTKSVFNSNTPEKLGGANYIVEIDKTKIGKKWVLGGICRETKECFFVPVEDCSQETLIPLIVERVEGRTHIYTDEWAGYKILSKLGYPHFTVNQSKHFVDPETGVNTNSIESTWWSLKRSLPTTFGTDDALAAHLAEYLWRRKNHSAACLFTNFLGDIVCVYPGPQ